MYILDHPGWDSIDGTFIRAMRTEAGTWLIIGSGDRTLITGSGYAPPVDTYDPATLDLAALPRGLGRALGALGLVRRWRNTDLWDAIATAIIRQVIRAGQAKKMHHAFRTAAGPHAAATTLIPAPEKVLAMTPEQFADLGMAFKRRPLQAAAAAYLDHHDEWAQLPADVLVKALQQVPHIGPWTAGAAVADHTGDYSLYPYADLAVRTWARAADPATAWPADEPGFATAWRHLASVHLSTLTVLTLAWGDHHARKPPISSGTQPR